MAVNTNLEEIVQRYTIRFGDIKPDWSVFGDSNYDGYRRAQFRYIGARSVSPREDIFRPVPRGCL